MKITHALVVKLVDTKDLKSLPFWECQFESGRGHHMVKPYIVSDKNFRSSKIKNAILKRVKSYSLIKSNLIIVIGGDGFMLETLKKYNKYKNLFME